MRQCFFFPFLVLPMVVPWAAALPQAANAPPKAEVKSKSQLSKPDEKILLVRAEQGDASSQMWLGAAYEQGWFGKSNFPEALKWFRKSAEHGDPDAQTSLGQMYEYGEGVTQTILWQPNGTEKPPSTTLIGEARDKGETTWEYSIWMGREFKGTMCKLTCGSGWLMLKQTCLLPKLT